MESSKCCRRSAAGQWQSSQDDAGRIYRNVNDAPLFVDYTPARYFLRNPNAARTRGLYESLIDQMEATSIRSGRIAASIAAIAIRLSR